MLLHVQTSLSRVPTPSRIPATGPSFLSDRQVVGKKGAVRQGGLGLKVIYYDYSLSFFRCLLLVKYSTAVLPFFFYLPFLGPMKRR